jgi:hypothetical protein
VKLSSVGKISLAILFLLVTYWPVSFMQFSMKFDMMDWFYPMRYLIGECLQNNVLPTWNPYTNLGYPLHTDPQSGALYPVVWLLGGLFGYSVYTIHLEFILHILLAFYGMKKLSEEIGVTENISIIVGLSYACCGFFVGNAQHLSWVISVAWIPFVLCYYLKLIRVNNWQNALWVAVFSFLLLTGGYPAFIITLFYLLGIVFLVRLSFYFKTKNFLEARKFVLNNCLFGIAFLLQSLCFLKYFLESLPFLVRTESLSLSDVQLLPFSPQSFLSFILPAITGGNTDFFKTDPSMSNGYIGLIGFLFALLYLWKKPDWKSITLWICGAFFLLVALGDYFFLREWLFDYIPMMNLFRYPSLFRVFALISLLLLFGLSIKRYQNKNVPSYDWKKLRIGGFLFLFLLTGIFIYAFQKSDLQLPTAWSGTSMVDFLNKSTNSQMVLIQAPIQITLLSLLLFKTFFRKGISFIKFALILILVDLFLSVQLNSFLTITSEASVYELQEKVKELPKGFPIPTENLSSVSHQGGRHFYPIWYNQNILRKKIAHNGYNNFKFKDYRSFTARADHMKILENSLLYDSGNAGMDSTSTARKGAIEITSFLPNRIEAQISFKEDGELTLLQYFYPGWKVKLNGAEIPAFKKEAIFLAAKVPKGEHQLIFEFYPIHFKGYLFLSGGFFLLILIYFIGKSTKLLRLTNKNQTSTLG